MSVTAAMMMSARTEPMVKITNVCNAVVESQKSGSELIRNLSVVKMESPILAHDELDTAE